MNLKAKKITENVYWVGAIDWGVRNFHGYTTSRGTTYNAFLIIDEKITLVDTVKKGFEEELLSRISSVIDPEKIDYIISNHSEPDHSGSIASVVKAVKPEKVFASKMGVVALKAHFGDIGAELVAVNDGETLSLGAKTVSFMETRMLHWPDSMFSYLVEDKVLFSQDAFGMHLATSERFDRELDWTLLEKQSSDYFANIITLYAPFVLKLIKKVAESGLEFKYVAPDHGPIWTDMDLFSKMVGLYQKWAERKVEKKAVVVFDTMWHSTEKMAHYIADSLIEEGIKVEVMPLSANDRSDVASELIDAAAIVAGSPTLNNNIFPAVADVLTYVKGLKFNTPVAAAFGSFGWSGEATKQVREYLEAMGCNVVDEVKAKYVPDEKVIESCMELGKKVAAAINQTVK